MRRNKLHDLSMGITLKRKRSVYLNSLVNALNDLRLRAMNKQNIVLASEISQAIRDVALVNANIATDAEIWGPKRD